MKKLLFVLLAFVAVMGIAAQDFVIGNGDEIQSLDPAHMQGVPEQKVFLALGEGLVVNDPKTCYAVPGIAESWKTSPDGTVITFKLRKSTWSDGEPVTAQTFVDSWLRNLDPDTASEYAYLIGIVVKGANEFNTWAPDKAKSDEDNAAAKAAAREAVGAKAIDDYTFEVTMVGPVAFALDMFAHQIFAPQPLHVIAKVGDQWTKPENFVSNGAFVLKEYKQQQYLLAVKNPKYWDAKNVKLASIKFLPVNDVKTEYNMLKNKEIDWATTIPNDLLDEVKLRPDYQVAPATISYYYIFNMTKKPFDDVRVRKALAMAIDKKAIVDKITKGGQIATNALVPPMAGYVPPKGNGYDPAQAKKLLAAAGFPGGKGFPATTVIYNTNENHKKIAEFVQQQWKTVLGIDVQLQNLEWKTFLDTRSNTHDFQITRAGWQADYLDPDSYLNMFVKGGGNNDGLYDNPKYDALIKKEAAMKGGADRNKAMQQAETLLVETDQHIIPFYYYVSQNLIDTKKWNGWYSNTLDTHPWKFISKK